MPRRLCGVTIGMNRRTGLRGLLIAGTLLFGSAPVAGAEVAVDWTRSGDPINRRIFSTQGFMQVYVEPDPMALKTFALTNPMGTSTRLEIYIHRLEPENDNADPRVFDWERMHPDRMIRFIDDRPAFERTAFGSLGMEPLALLCYNTPWLKRDNPDDIVSDHDEWAEFAAAVVESFNGRGHDPEPPLQYVEVWNEPNFAEFRMGTPEAYCDLFSRVADRIHRDYPGVQVGGPAISHAPTGHPEAWMDAFLETCASKADFLSWHHYGPRGEPVDRIIHDLTTRMTRFRKLPGRQNGKAMITEIDAWFHGFPKMQYIFERQFRFLGHADLIHSVHHFCCLAYSTQGNYTFGVVRQRGGVMPGVFWPYWLFRNLMGHESPTTIGRTQRNDLRLIASRFEERGRFLGTAVLHNGGSESTTLDIRLRFPAVERERVLACERVAERFCGPERVARIPAGADRHTVSVKLGPGEGLALTLHDAGRRMFPFADLNNQETPWIGLTASKPRLGFGESCDLHVRVLNTTVNTISGRIGLRALPEDWRKEVVSGSDQIAALAFGQEHECTIRIKAMSVVDEGSVSPYAVLARDVAEQVEQQSDAHSIPAFVWVDAPFVARVLPRPIRAVPGEVNQATLQIVNKRDHSLKCRLALELPGGCTAKDHPRTVQVPRRARRRFQLPFRVQEDMPAGERSGSVTIHALGADLAKTFMIEVSTHRPPTKSIPLDLGTHFNIDALAFDDDRMAFDIEKVGQFAFPADFVPAERIARVRGVPFRLGSLVGRDLHAIEPHGQRIVVPPDRYTRVAFLGFGHSGEHHGMWTFHYADGSWEDHASQVPEWCTPPPPGSENYADAFNAPYRYIKGGPAPPACQLFSWFLPVDDGKELTALKLPEMDNAYLFGITLLVD